MLRSLDFSRMKSLVWNFFCILPFYGKRPMGHQTISESFLSVKGEKTIINHPEQRTHVQEQAKRRTFLKSETYYGSLSSTSERGMKQKSDMIEVGMTWMGAIQKRTRQIQTGKIFLKNFKFWIQKWKRNDNFENSSILRIVCHQKWAREISSEVVKGF